jgi:peptidyl-prolyl cis-trans isomerase B (cyclophilin B)
MTRAGIGAVLLSAVALAGCGSGSSGSTASVGASGAPSSTASSGPNSNGCMPPPSAQPSHQQYSHEPKLTIARTSYTATIKTNCGTIVVRLDGKNAPHTVNSFAFLASKHYFDNTRCHRLTTSGIYVLQCGDPTSTGTGGPGYRFRDENLAGAKYPAGTVAMANAGPGTNGSQFFFVYADTALPPHYTPFGTVVQGMDVLKRIAAAGSNPPGDGAPVQPVTIESFVVTKGA